MVITNNEIGGPQRHQECKEPELFCLQPWLTICGPAFGSGKPRTVIQPFDTWLDLAIRKFNSVECLLRASNYFCADATVTNATVTLLSAYDEQGTGEQPITSVTIARNAGLTDNGYLQINAQDSRLGRYLYWRVENGTIPVPTLPATGGEEAGDEPRVCFQIDIVLK